MSKERANRLPDCSDVLQAASRIQHLVHRTPVLTCDAIDRMAGVCVVMKCENFQKVGAFKYRGASNAVASLSDDEARAGVATHSSGNHAAALALAALRRGIPAYVVMPRNAPAVKVAAVRSYGGHIEFCEPTLEARESTLAKVVAATGARFIHPYDDAAVIAGQGTAALELLEQEPAIDVLLAPVGGGGLMSGTCLAVAGRAPSVRLYGAEPQGADDAYRSLRNNEMVPSVHPNTVADGLLTSLSERTFSILRQHLQGVVTVDDDEILRAMRFVWERMKIVIEPSAAVPLAVLLARKIDPGRKAGVILSGGNVDLDRLPWGVKGN
jgi:threonine dehydratase